MCLFRELSNPFTSGPQAGQGSDSPPRFHLRLTPAPADPTSLLLWTHPHYRYGIDWYNLALPGNGDLRFYAGPGVWEMNTTSHTGGQLTSPLLLLLWHQILLESRNAQTIFNLAILRAIGPGWWPPETSPYHGLRLVSTPRATTVSRTWMNFGNGHVRWWMGE